MTKKLDGIMEGMKIAESHDGKCLSVEYINNKTKMLWQCKSGHQWETVLGVIKRGHWCPSCAGKAKLSLKIAQDIAKKKNGKCLNIEYIGNHVNMLWGCKLGHRWKASFKNIKRGHWCPECSCKKKLNLGVAKQIAKGHNGKCLSTEYVNNSTKIRWQCKYKHRWNAGLSDIKNHKTWCPECGYLQAAKNSNNSYILYHWKTGEELVCQASYEKIVVEYFNVNKINFRWQSKTFKMPNGKTYRPDCYLFSTRKWIEIKGYFREKNKIKWDWFQTIKSNSELWDKNKLKSMGILR